MKEIRLLAVIIAGDEGKLERVRDSKFVDCVKVLKFIEDTCINANYWGRSNTIVSVYVNVLEIVRSRVAVKFDWTVLLFEEIEAGWKGAACMLLILEEHVSILIASGHWE